MATNAAYQEVLNQAYSGNPEAVHSLTHLLGELSGEGQAVRSRLLLEDLTTKLQQIPATGRAMALAFYALGQAYLREARLLDASQAFATARVVAEDKTDNLYLSATAYHAYALEESELSSHVLHAQFHSVVAAQDSSISDTAKLLSLGLLNYSLGHYEMARANWQRVVQIDGALNTYLAYSAMLNLVQLDLKTNDLAGATAQLALLKKKYPQNAAGCDVLVAESDIYATSGKWADAARLLTEAYDDSTDDPDVTYRLGVAHAALANVPEARGYLERTIVISPWFAKAHTSMAKLDRSAPEPTKTPKIGFLDNRYARVWIPIAIFILAAAIVGFAGYSAHEGTTQDGKEVKKTEITCPIVSGAPTPAPSSTPAAAACAPKTETIITTTTAAQAAGPPAIDARYLAIASAIAAVGLVILLMPYVNKVAIGPVQLDRATPTPKAPGA